MRSAVVASLAVLASTASGCTVIIEAGERTGDAGIDSPDAVGPGDGVDAGPLPPSGTLLYTGDRTHSPVTAELAEHWRQVAAAGTGDMHVFAKIGDSHTARTNFLYCFAGSSYSLEANPALQSTLDFFRQGNAAGSTPYDRASVSGIGGWTAGDALYGSPNAIEREVAAIGPRFATVLYGTNDIGYTATINNDNIDGYGQNMLTIADLLLARGIVPIFSTIPERIDRQLAIDKVPRFNAVVRAVAQGRGLPLLDLNRELAALPSFGISSDEIHMSSYPGGDCVLTTDGMQYGTNRRNWLTLEALERVRQVVVDGAERLDPDDGGVRLTGDGSPEAPFVIPSLPFSDLRDTTAGTSGISSYACATANEGGPEIYYRLDLAAPATVRVRVIDRGSVDNDIHVLQGAATSAACVGRNDREVVVALPAGTHYLVVDSYIGSAGAPLPGEYLLAVTQD